MLVDKELLNDLNFSSVKNQNLIENSGCVKYLFVYFDNKFIFENSTTSFAKKVSKVYALGNDL